MNPNENQNLNQPPQPEVSPPATSGIAVKSKKPKSHKVIAWFCIISGSLCALIGLLSLLAGNEGSFSFLTIGSAALFAGFNLRNEKDQTLNNIEVPRGESLILGMTKRNFWIGVIFSVFLITSVSILALIFNPVK